VWSNRLGWACLGQKCQGLIVVPVQPWNACKHGQCVECVCLFCLIHGSFIWWRFVQVRNYCPDQGSDISYIPVLCIDEPLALQSVSHEKQVNKTIHLSCYRVPKMKRFKADYFKKQNEAKGGGFWGRRDSERFWLSHWLWKWLNQCDWLCCTKKRKKGLRLNHVPTEEIERLVWSQSQLRGGYTDRLTCTPTGLTPTIHTHIHTYGEIRVINFLMGWRRIPEKPNANVGRTNTSWPARNALTPAPLGRYFVSQDSFFLRETRTVFNYSTKCWGIRNAM